LAKIVVAGATGLIGSAVAAELTARGHTVISLGRRSGASIQVDFADIAGLRGLKLPPCDALIHCAGVTDEEVKSDAAAALHRAALGTEALIGGAIDAGAGKIVYVSSAHVYGALSGPIDETTPPNPLSNYALAHFMAEQVLRRNALSRGAMVRLLRPCAVFGPLPSLQHFRRWSLIPFAFPRAIAESGVIRIMGTGRDRRNFVGTDRIAVMAAGFAERPVPGVTIVNPVGARDLTVAEFAGLCVETGRRVLGKAGRVEIAGVGDDAGPPLDYRSIAGCRQEGRTLEAHVTELIHECSQIGVHA
jgi:UDP-glucose 4-epimerase